MSLKDATSRIEKQFGRGSIRQLDDSDIVPVQVISTGSLKLDLALGVGGWPRGRVVEAYGPEASGKTTIALQLIAEAQKIGEQGAIIDAEHALDANYATKLGVDTGKLWVSQPSCGEEGLEIAEALIRSNEIAVVVVDSVSLLVPRAELSGEFGDAHMGLQARMMSQGMRKLTEATHTSNCILLFLNQLRSKIGVVFGNPEVTSGGRALQYAASVRLDIRRKEAIKRGEEIVGAQTRIKIQKNKLASPFREVLVDLIYGDGFSKESDLIDLGVETGLLEKSGSWITVYGERFQGRDNAIAGLKDNKELAGKLEAEIRAKYKSGQ